MAALACLLSACPPTLSRPHSDAHLDALATGDRHARHGRDAEAAHAYATAAQTADRRVDRDEALYRQARAEIDAENTEAALELLMRIAETQPPSRRTARALLDAGRLRFKEDPSAGLDLFEKLVRDHPDSGPAARALTLWVMRLESAANGADNMLEGLYADLRRTKLGDDILAHLARIRSERGDREGTRRALETIVRSHPYPTGHRWDDAALQLAAMDVEDGEPRRAIARLRRLLERSEGTTLIGSYTLPAFPEALITIARLERSELTELEAADADYAAVYDQFETSRLRDDALVERGEMWLEAGDLERGCQLLRKAVEEFEVGSARRRAASRVQRQCR